jgi:Lon protease-like protein
LNKIDSSEYSSFADYGTLLFIRDLVYTSDGRSVVDTSGQERFRVLDRGTRDGYDTARIQLIQDHPIEQEEFDGLFDFRFGLLLFIFNCRFVST